MTFLVFTTCLVSQHIADPWSKARNKNHLLFFFFKLHNNPHKHMN